MPRRVVFEGVEHAFPDDATDDEIRSNLEAATAPAFQNKAQFPPNLGNAQKAPLQPDKTLENLAGVASKAGDLLTANPIERSGGTTLTKLYEGAGEGLKQISEKVLGEKYSTTRERLPFLKGVETVGNLGKVVPEVIDSMYSPAGAAMTAMPASRFYRAIPPQVKAAVGAVFGAPQAMDLKDSVSALTEDVTPENVADVAVKGAMTVMPFLANRANPAHRGNRRKFETAAVDDTAPLRHFEQDGGGVAPEKSAHLQARNSKGLTSVIQQDMDQLKEILPKRAEVQMGFSPYGVNPMVVPTKKLSNMERYGILNEYEKQFNINKKYQTPEGYTKQTLQAAKQQLEIEMGPEQTAEVQQRLKDLYALQDRLLDTVHAVGAISDDHYNNIKANQAKGEGYLPLHRIAYIADNLDENIPVGSSAWNVAQQNLVKNRKAEGSTLAVANPFESVIENIGKANKLIEQQKVGMKLAAHANNPAFKGLIEPIGNGVDPGKGRGTFNVLQDGKKLTFAVPKDVGDVMKGLNREQADLVTGWASKSAAALRAGATTLYLPFLPANMIRDYQTAHVTTGLTPIDWVKGLAEGIKQGKDFDLFMRSGGGQSGLFGKSGLSQMDRRAASLKDLTTDPLTAGLKSLRPDRLLQSVGEKIELAPRLGAFKRALHGPTGPVGSQSSPLGTAPAGFGPRGGITNSPTVAAFMARNSTVDFSKAGSVGRVVNRWVPFLNARLQGNINFYGSLKNNPPAASAMRLGMVVGLPVIATHIWNSKYPEVMKDMAENEKDQNFVVVGGTEKDEQGRWTNVLKFPKGEVAPFATLLETYLDHMQQNTPKEYGKLAMEIASGMSPIPFERDGKFAPGRAVGAVTPPLARAAIEGVTNTNFYTGREIVPKEFTMTGAAPEEQYPAGTPELYVRAGKALGTSPMKIQNAAVAQFGGLGRVAAYPSKAGGGISNRFVGATGGAQQQKDFDMRQEAQQERGDRVMQEKRAVQQIVSAPPEQRAAIYKQALPQDPQQAEKFNQQLLTAFQKQKAAVEHETFARVLKTDPPEVRARTILKKLETLPTPEEKTEFMKAMQSKRILIPEVIRHMQRLQPIQ